MTALKAHEVERFVVRPNLKNGVFLIYGPDAGLVREVAQKLIAFFRGDSPSPGAELSSASLTLDRKSVV